MGVPPPILFLGAWAAGARLHHRYPLTIADAHSQARRLVGGVLVASGTCLSAMVTWRFAQASTPISPLREARALVTDGPYRYSRNPDYIGQSLIYTGSAIAANRAWPLMLLPFVLTLVTCGVVAREERNLERQFGAVYREYCERVPRWL